MLTYLIISIVIIIIIFLLLFFILGSSKHDKKDTVDVDVSQSQSQGVINVSRADERADNISDFTKSVGPSIVKVGNRGTLPIINVLPDIPDEYDLFKEYPNLITPALDQTVCGDCYAFATSTAVSDSLRIGVHKYNIENNTNIKFPLNEWVKWFYTVKGATRQSLPQEDTERGQESLRFDLPEHEDHLYPVLNNVSALGLAILEPDYDFFGFKGLVGGGICAGGNPLLTLEVLLAWNFLPNECRMVSIPPIFPNWTKARYVPLKEATELDIKSCNDVQGDRVFLCPRDEEINQRFAVDNCNKIFNGGCPITYMDDYLHKFIPSLLTGFSCEDDSDRYCVPSETIAALYFLQMPYSNFNYQINGFNLISQRNANTLRLTYGHEYEDNIKNVIKSYIMTTGPLIVNMRISAAFFSAYVSNPESDEILFSRWDTGDIYYPIDVVNDIENGIKPTTYPVFSIPFDADRGLHSLNILGWGKCKNSKGDIKDYWICRNSWGIKWADKGNFMILDDDNQMGTYICTLSSLALNIDPQIKRIVDHYENYELISSEEYVIDTKLLSQYFNDRGSAGISLP